MSARKPKSSSATFFSSTFVAIAVFGAASSAAPRAHAQEADPFAGEPPAVPESNVAAPSQQAPASAPAGSDANFPTGLVERLPSSAYPEPVIRGLYGSSLWLDMQGHQWPYYPRIGVGLSGYGWVDTDYKRTRIGDLGQSDHTTKLFGQGRFALRVTPTYTNGSWFAQAQAELIANLDQLDPQPQVADTDDLWVRTGVWKKLGRHRRPVRGVLRLPPGHGPGPQHRRAHRRLRQPRRRLGPAAVPRELPLLPAPGPAEHRAPPLLRAAASASSCSASGATDNTVNALGGRPALIYDLGWLKFRIGGGVPVALRAGPRAHLAQRVAGTAAWPAPCSSSSPRGSNSARTSAAPSPTSSRTRSSRTAHSRWTPASRATSGATAAS